MRVLVLMLLTACGTTRLPTAQFDSARTAVDTARATGAGSTPAAIAHLKAAEVQLEEGRALIGAGEYERARWVSARAQAEAELATAIARGERIEREARLVDAG